MTERPSASKPDWKPNALALLALVLALANMLQAYLNRGLQAEVLDGQAQLAKAQTLANVDNSLIQLLAKSAAENDDKALRDLLARNGVTFKANAAAQKAPEPTAEEK
ncbi:MAG: hypothetical protein IPG62_14355 [Sphingomonadales bacterium]|nr:hypothetical protein [Sphingomonadales bacterium]